MNIESAKPPESGEAKRLKPLALNEGHGHVFPRPDGVRARCGGAGYVR